MSDITINVKNDGMLGRIGTEGLGQKLIEMSRIADRQQEEIERLNKEIETLKQPQIFIDTQDMEERYGEELYQEYLEKKIKRLNNIINELEKWLEENIKLKPLQTTYFLNCDGKQRSISEIELKELKRVFDKLQELKGDGSNENDL